MLFGSFIEYRKLPRNAVVGKDLVIRADIFSYLKLPRDVPYLGRVWGKFFSKKLIDSNSIKFDEKISTFEDVLFLMKAIFKSETIKFVDEPLLVQNFIIKSQEKKATLAQLNLARSMGFQLVANYLKETLPQEIKISEEELKTLLTRYTGYLFYFNLLIIARETSLLKLWSLFWEAKRIIKQLDKKFDQSSYKVCKETGESFVVGILNRHKAWSLAVLFASLKAKGLLK